MAKLKRSNEHQTFSDIARLFEERKAALRSFCVPGNGYFVQYSKKEVMERLSQHLHEAEYDASLALLAAMEAALRLDFDTRDRKRLKDSRSQAARQLAKTVKGVHFRIPIGELCDLFAIDRSVPNHVISKLKICFNYRHWLAHGRYWQLKQLQVKPTFSVIFQLAQTIKGALIS